MKPTEIRELGLEDLWRKLTDLKEEQSNLKFQHATVYKKYVRRRNRFAAHDETNECRVGDTVLIRQSRPLSRHKRWRVSKVLVRVA
ncbi:MAG: 50S ribosomal protein L29 [Desulfarculus sp.]|nr:50S ribosomal protein L29 [Desulfarculus sp.]